MDEKMYKGEFHIYYPYLTLHGKHRYFILEYLIELMVNDEFLDGIAYQNDKIEELKIDELDGEELIYILPNQQYSIEVVIGAIDEVKGVVETIND